MPLAELRSLLDYHYWARDRLLTAVAPLPPEQFTRDMGNSFRSVRDTLVHVYSAEWAWYQRWIGISPTVHLPVEDYPDLAAVRTAWESHEAKVRHLVAGLGEEGVDRMCDYRLFSGVEATSTFGEMIRHVVNHATYHRGQVTTMLRQMGAAPPASLDLITFYRETQRRPR